VAKLPPVSERLPLRVGTGVGLVAGCVLALQVLLTRLFSATLFYHFTFLGISLALLGAGAGAILVYVRPDWFGGPVREQLVRWSVAFAATLVVIPAVIVRLHFAVDGALTTGFVVRLAAASALTTLMFLAGGITIALAIRAYTADVSRLYAMDLVGAALGAVVVVPLMWLVSAPTLVVALAPVAGIAALLFAADGGRRSPPALAAVLAGVVAVALAGSTHLYRLAPSTPAEAGGASAVADVWTPLSRVVGYPPPKASRFALLFYDKVYAPVAIYHRGGRMPDWHSLLLGPQTIGYAMTPHRDALVIGGGGGRDILNALTQGTRHVDVIELNRAIVSVVDHEMRRWSGSPYTLPRVSTRAGDGRSELARRDAKYDVIHLGFTDTLSSNSAQAFALTENNLYTTQALGEYLDHLRPGGILEVSRLYRLVGDEALRATVLALEALRARHVADPARHVVVVLGRDVFNSLFGTVLVKNEPWTPAELARVRALGSSRGEGVAYAPGGPYALEWRGLHDAASPAAFCKAYRLDVCAPTDDRPFFFQMRRLGSLGSAGPGYLYSTDPFAVLLVTFAILAGLSLALVAAPLALTSRGDRPPVRSLLFFAMIGIGFLSFEVVLIQRLVLMLGFPTYALSIALFALLLWTGVGSALTHRVRDERSALLRALGGACALIALSIVVLLPVTHALISAPFAIRVAVTIALLAPVGVALGTAMPLGLRRFSAAYPSGVPWAWGVNAVASVLASAGAIALAILFGFRAATALALACYVIALLDVARSDRLRPAGP
jgi:hypothetical protein